MGNGQTIPIGERQLKVLKNIAEGAYGFVDLVEDINTKRLFVIKRIISQDNQTLYLANLEINTLKLITPHPNIVGFYGSVKRDIFDQRNTSEFYILLEYCPHTLSNIINTRINMPLKEVEILDYFAPICSYIIILFCYLY